MSITGQTALPEAGRKQIDDYLKGVYVKYHGSEEGLDQLKQQARSQPFPPPDFKVQSKAEIAASQPQEPEAVGFLEIRDILSAGGEKATSLFERIKGKSFTMKGMVVSATPRTAARTARLAVTEETANKPNAYDVELTLSNPQRLSAGQMVEFEGMVNGFNPTPFSLAMVDGQIKSVEGGAAADPPATKKAPAAKRPAGKKRR